MSLTCELYIPTFSMKHKTHTSFGFCRTRLCPRTGLGLRLKNYDRTLFPTRALFEENEFSALDATACSAGCRLSSGLPVVHSNGCILTHVSLHFFPENHKVIIGIHPAQHLDYRDSSPTIAWFECHGRSLGIEVAACTPFPESGLSKFSWDMTCGSARAIARLGASFW